MQIVRPVCPHWDILTKEDREFHSRRLGRTVKYVFKSDWEVQTPFIDMACVGANGLIILDTFGLMKVREGYLLDGPSGLAVDTVNFMPGAGGHDPLYQLCRERKLNNDEMRKPIDQFMNATNEEFEMLWFRRKYVYRFVRLFGGPSARPR